MKRIETQVGQIAGTVGELVKQAKPGKLPSQSEQAQAITVLRGGKVIHNKVGEPSPTNEVEKEGDGSSQEKENLEQGKVPILHKAVNPYTPPIPYLSRLRNEKQNHQFQEF